LRRTGLKKWSLNSYVRLVDLHDVSHLVSEHQKCE
jgi:hypothetical protein